MTRLECEHKHTRREYVRLYGEPEEKRPQKKDSQFIRPGVPFGYRVIKVLDGQEELERDQEQIDMYIQEDKTRAEARKNNRKNTSANRRGRGRSAAQRVAAKARKASQADHKKATPDPASDNATVRP